MFWFRYDQNYAGRSYQNDGRWNRENIRIKILTFHGSKGKECDNVVWFPDYGAENEVKPYRGACDNPDVQHRLVFVAVTRTKQKLYLMAPLTDGNYYTIGEPILWK